MKPTNYFYREVMTSVQCAPYATECQRDLNTFYAYAVEVWTESHANGRLPADEYARQMVTLMQDYREAQEFIVNYFAR